MTTPQHCADCSGPIGQGAGPPDGWQLEDERTVCHACCKADTRRIVVSLLDALQRRRERQAISGNDR